MKLANLVGQANRSFASVFLAFSLFGFLFPHHANQVQSNHQVNLKSSEQVTHQNSDDQDQEYLWFY
jgi:hypothetical protein